MTTLLLMLGLVPALAGLARLGELIGGAEITAENARFFAMPVPVVLHIASVLPYSLLGAFQLHAGLRRRRPAWHRTTGRYLVVLGMVAALTGLWMAHAYPWPPGDGSALYFLRLGFGSAMLGCLVLAVVAVRRRDFHAHGAWMMRAYAIGMGAGTQVLTHVPWFILVGQPTGPSRAALMGAGWVINVAGAEWVIRRTQFLRSGSSAPAPRVAAVKSP